MKKINILVTGGAGFIGSHLAEKLISDKRVGLVRVLDNLSTGKRFNMKTFMHSNKFEFVWGDIREYSICTQACKNIDVVCHQAALGSVPRSISKPLTTNNVNITGTLNVFTAAKEMGVKKIVYAASSSTYGNSAVLPKREHIIGDPISPYAVTKLVNELYANVYSKLYDIKFIGLRYFNVFGPKQDANGAYAAVIPLFIKAVIDNKTPTINGDGLQSRDFTYVDNAVSANIKAIFNSNPLAHNQVYNIACGERTSINELFNLIKIAGNPNTDLQPIYGPSREGDVKHSLADISKARKLLNYKPIVNVEDGIVNVIDWYLHNEAQNKVLTKSKMLVVK